MMATRIDVIARRCLARPVISAAIALAACSCLWCLWWASASSSSSLATAIMNMNSIIPSTAARQGSVPARAPGVAFGLAPDYGTVAVHFPDASFAKVAKIEGSPAYKAFMTRDCCCRAEALCDAIPAIPTDDEGEQQQQQQEGEKERDNRKNTPPAARPEDIDAVAPLLRILKASAASYLGAAIYFADLVMPDPRLRYQKAVLETALRAVGLRQTLDTLSAGKLAALAANHQGEYNRSFCCTENSPNQSATAAAASFSGTALVIDYSCAAFDAMLLYEDGGDVIDILRHEHNPRLGARHAANNSASHWGDMRASLGSLIQVPLPRSPWGQRLDGHIDRLVLYGDSADDADFRALVTDLVGEELDLVAGDPGSVFDPVFASAVGMARASCHHMDQMDIGTELSLLRRWASALYRSSAEDGET